MSRLLLTEEEAIEQFKTDFPGVNIINENDAIKTVLVGAGAVGKSTLIRMLCGCIEFSEDYDPTRMAQKSFTLLNTNMGGIVLELTDSSGQSLNKETLEAKALYENVEAVVVMFDHQSSMSYNNAGTMLNSVVDELKKFKPPGSENDVYKIPFVVLGNKADLCVNRKTNKIDAMASQKKPQNIKMPKLRSNRFEKKGGIPVEYWSISVKNGIAFTGGHPDKLAWEKAEFKDFFEHIIKQARDKKLEINHSFVNKPAEN